MGFSLWGGSRGSGGGHYTIDVGEEPPRMALSAPLSSRLIAPPASRPVSGRGRAIPSPTRSNRCTWTDRRRMPGGTMRSTKTVLFTGDRRPYHAGRHEPINPDRNASFERREAEIVRGSRRQLSTPRV